MAPAPIYEEQAMKYYSVASLNIQDYRQFKEEFDSIQELLQKWGFKRTYLNRDVDDPSHLVIVHEVESLDRAREFYKSQDFQQCAQKAGVVGAGTVTFVEELARTPEPVSV
jgi:uncharacterized protein (DUF1330 family)